MDSEALCAVTKGDLKKLQERLNRGININAQDEDGRTFLHHAASICQFEVTSFLMQHGTDVFLTSNKNNTALHIAATKGSTAIIAAILDNVGREKLKKLLDVKTKTNGNTALHAGAKHPIVSLQLLAYGSNYEAKNFIGEKPINLASFEEGSDKTYILFKMIFGFFEMAAEGNLDILKCLKPEDTLVFTPYVNSRNNEGHTFLQVLLLNGHVKIASEVLKKRASFTMLKKQAALHDPSRKSEIDQLVEIAVQCHDFWIEFKDVMKHHEKEEIGKKACRMLEKVHEMLLAYRKFDGMQQSLTYDQVMKTLEDIFEIFGFDPEQCYRKEGEKDCYYKKLSARWKKDISIFMDIMERMVFGSIIFALRSLNGAQMFHAVKENDVLRMKQLISNGAPMDVIDYTDRSVLCHAAENGKKKIVKLLLKSGAVVLQYGTLTPIYLSARKGHAKVVKLLLEKADSKHLVTSIDWRPEPEGPGDDIAKYLDLCTALHAAAMKGRLDIVKILLSYGATYLVLDEEKRTPLQVSSSQEVSEFLKLVDECFRDAKKANVELVAKLKAMQTDELLAVAGTRNLRGQTLAGVVAAKAKGKNISKIISKMIKEAKQQDEH